MKTTPHCKIFIYKNLREINDYIIKKIIFLLILVFKNNNKFKFTKQNKLFRKRFKINLNHLFGKRLIFSFCNELITIIFYVS